MQPLLRRLNESMIATTRKSLVCSMFIMTFDHRSLRARFINAGHLPPLLVRNTDGTVHVRTISMRPSSLVGDSEAPDFAEGDIQFAPSEMFLLFTDGLVECTNANGDPYDFKRLRRALAEIAHVDAITARDLILKDALAFYGGAPLQDDVTFIVGRTR